MKRLAIARHATQLLILALFLCLPWLNAAGFQHIRGSLFAFEAFGVPFADPASVTQATLSGGLHGDWPVLSFYIGPVIVLLVALLFGRVFCGWLCPYGFMSELVWKARKKQSARPGKLMFPSRCAAFLLLLAASLVLALPLITEFSMPGQLSLLPMLRYQEISVWTSAAFVLVPAALICELALARRLWCQYACPQSVLLSLAAWLSSRFPTLRITWQPAHCKCGNKMPCKKACSLNLNPRQKKGPDRKNCTMCGDCVSACARNGGALKFGLK